MALSPNLILAPIFLLLLLLLVRPPVGETVTSECKADRPIIFNFGDSNSDTGGLVAGLGYTVDLPNGRSFFRRSTGRLSDGRLIIDFLCESLNTSFLSPYLDSLGGTKFSSGANFAVVGSSTLPKNVPFSLNVQVMQFTHFKSRSLELVNAGTDYGLTNDVGFSNAIYMIDIGQNDIARAFADGMLYPQVLKRIPTVTMEIRDAIKALYDEGGRNFWVHNTGPIGCLPQKLTLARNKNLELDQHGCISSYNNAAKYFNEELSRTCQNLRLDLKDAKIIYVDMYSIKYDLIANSSAYGISSPLMACCGSGGLPYNYDTKVTCGRPGYNVCDEESRFVSWDGIHYTEAANSIVASKIISGNYSTPQEKFGFVCKS